ncbi:MAG: hypothetical protein QF756_01975 [Dehalococcoidia bacterium]|jgi:hypothetical protein|nr:hypothetical protein [Dehalococcoidia bacterium]MDP6273906.1 hypothetical protein [Dehalococcoidia bacterium]MDP7160013.1 hypothetical protein [Dehalococcoidia bacterium]MDP7212370.1 hypothetical protein [Dehalococcoidia bacterium]|tara:strand:+ start:683 stop:850 length:168 start_codon:yes stop_codon:yes gene_type:complete
MCGLPWSLSDAFLDAHNNPANGDLMDALLPDWFVVPDPETYIRYLARRVRVNAYW